MKFSKFVSKAILLSLLATTLIFRPSYAANTALENLEKQFEDFRKSDLLEKTFTYKGNYNELRDEINGLIYQAFNTNDIQEYNTYYVEPRLINDGQTTKIILTKYIYNSKEDLNYAEEFARKEAFNIVKKEDSDLIKVIKLSDYMGKNYSYDPDMIVHDVKTLIDKKYGVCSSYAILFYELANAAGIETYCQRGQLDGVNHIWNIVKVNGKFYYIDVTGALSYKMSDVFLTGLMDLDIYKDNELSGDYTLKYKTPEVPVENYEFDFTSMTEGEKTEIRAYIEELEKRFDAVLRSYADNGEASKILAEKYEKSKKLEDYKELINFRNQLALGSDMRKLVDGGYVMPFYEDWLRTKQEKLVALATREITYYYGGSITKLKSLIREIENFRVAIKSEDLNPFRTQNEPEGLSSQIDFLLKGTIYDTAELYINDMKKKKTKISYNTAANFIKQYNVIGYEEILAKYKKIVK